MPYHYIALLNCGADSDFAHDPSEIHVRLHARGMDCRLSIGGMRLYVGKGTPSLVLPGGGLIIGHVFPRNGDIQSVVRSMAICGINSEQHLLENFWGEYIAVLPGDHNGRATSILRDPSGGVSCIYSIESGAGFVASDVSIPRELGLWEPALDWEAVTHSLVFTHYRGTRTGLRGISELLPGCVLEIHEGMAEQRSAWSPWKFVRSQQRHLDPIEAAFSVRQAVTTAVTTWAELDRSVLLELSGGLDSSIVAACLRDVQARTVCCTVTTPSPGTDERPYAQHMADLLGVELHTLHIDADAARPHFPPPPNAVVPGMTVAQHIVDTSLSEAADIHGTNSFMSGSGGDTVFCYLRNASPAADAFRRAGPTSGFSAIRNLSALHGCPLSKAARLTFKKLLRGPGRIRHANLAFLGPEAALAGPMPHPWLNAPRDASVGDQEWIGALAGTQCYVDGMTRNRYRPVRFPLLSQPVMEACLRVPTWMWIAGGRNRAIARDAFSDILPPPVLNRTSKGSYVAFAGSLYSKHRKEMLRFLEQGQLSARDLLDIPALRAFMNSDAPPKDTSFLRIFDLCMIESWARHQGAGTLMSPLSGVPTSRIERQIAY